MSGPGRERGESGLKSEFRENQRDTAGLVGGRLVAERRKSGESHRGSATGRGKKPLIESESSTSLSGRRFALDATLRFPSERKRRGRGEEETKRSNEVGRLAWTRSERSLARGNNLFAIAITEALRGSARLGSARKSRTDRGTAIL